MSPATCKNCNDALPAKAAYCPACGQSVKAITRPWREMLGELVTELFDFDGRMFVSLRCLLTRPGFLSQEYTSGRRLSHTSPVRMYLVISLVFFFVLPMILPEAPGASHQVAVDQYSKAMFLLLPVFALLLKLFYRQTYYLPNVVFVLYLFSALFIVFAVMMSIEAAADRYVAVMVLQLLLLVYAVAYFIIALRVNFQESWLKSSLKFLALFLIYSALIALMIDLASHF